MRIKIPGIVISFLFCVAGLHAQDTSRTLIMSQHAYDSTLRAIKKAAEVKQKDSVKDTVKPGRSITGQDTVKQITPEVKKNPESITGGVPFVSNDNITKERKDTNKKGRKRYPSTGYIGIFTGEGYPKGNFKLKGYPSKGGSFSFLAAFPGIISRFGIAFKADYGWNGVDKLRFMDSLKSNVGNPNLSYSMPSESFNYKYKTILLGLYASWPINSKFSIDARLLCGAMMATIPGLTVTAFDYSTGNTLTVKTYQTTGRAFAFNEGISVRYIPLPQLSVILGMDNVSANPSFTLVGTGITKDLNGAATQITAQSTTSNQAFHLLNVSVGIAFTISARK